MKLFSEVVLKHRKDPLFSSMWNAYSKYIDLLKQRVKEGAGKHDQNNALPET